MNGKKWTAVLVSLGIFLLSQLFAAVWWASAIDTKLATLKENQDKIELAIQEGMRDRYTGEDADRDLERQKTRDSKQDDRINKLHTSRK